MSFTHIVKKEVLSFEYSYEQAIDFVSGIIAVSGEHVSNKYIIKINNSDISNDIRDMLDQLKIKHKTHTKNKNWIVILNFKPNRDVKMPAQFFSGIFVGGGSISDPKTSYYHLEIQFIDGEIASKIKKYLNKYYFNFVEIKRRNNWVIYIKKSEMLTDFLRVIGAFNSLMIFENERINRDFKNQLNRYSNLDAYNQRKLAYASSVFQDEYKFIKKQNLLSKFTDLQIGFYELKHHNPYLSLSELNKKFNSKFKLQKTRSCLNHYLIKLRKIYSQNI